MLFFNISNEISLHVYDCLGNRDKLFIALHAESMNWSESGSV